MDTLAQRLKYARKRAGLTQYEIAARVGIAQPVYNRLETGKAKKTAYIVQIAQVYGVNPYWLATGNLPDMHTSFAHTRDAFPMSALHS